MSDDLTTLREKAERYRRLMNWVADERAATVLSKLISEIDAKIEIAEGRTTATQSQQEQPLKPK
jgi:hypothetical protein